MSVLSKEISGFLTLYEKMSEICKFFTWRARRSFATIMSSNENKRIESLKPWGVRIQKQQFRKGRRYQKRRNEKWGKIMQVVPLKRQK